MKNDKLRLTYWANGRHLNLIELYNRDLPLGVLPTFIKNKKKYFLLHPLLDLGSAVFRVVARS